LGKVTIIGSGFGLYGYLPALVDGCGLRVTLPGRYRQRFDERPELNRFRSAIEWSRDERAALDISEGVVLATTPHLQAEWISACLELEHIGYLLIEKPIAASPSEAMDLLDRLHHSGKIFRIGYVFRYTDWALALSRALKSPSSKTLRIQWRFLAHHLAHQLHIWKRFNSTGGGAIRFYGIQLIALLAEFGYREIVESKATGPTRDEVAGWTATTDAVVESSS